MEIAEIWRLYQQGIEFKNSINLYETVTRNERFYAGDQWAGVHAPDLPKPVVNFIRRACQQKVAEVRANPTQVCFSPVEFPSDVVSGKEYENANPDETELLNALFEADWERMGMDAVNLNGLQDACVSGDYILYNYWDPDARTGQALSGQICVETVDNVNYYPGNPNERDVQKQPCIIIARREIADDVRREAERYGMSSQEELIYADSNTLNQSGDMSHVELRGNANGKCITLLYLWKDAATGHIMAQKCTKNALVRPCWDTLLTRYPIAMMNWETRKNCCHGRAEITGLIPVQRYINQMYAMAMLFTMQSACPKPLFNQGLIKTWSTAVGTAIPVNGDVEGAAKYLSPPALSSDVYSLPDRLMRTTLEMAGVTNVALGNFDAKNYSALVAARDTAAVPMETIKSRFYTMIEDFARNWFDMLIAFGSAPRWAKVNLRGKPRNVVIDPSGFIKTLWNIKIDVGSATRWSQATAVQVLNNLYSSGAINAGQYIERLPDGYIPMRDKLLNEIASGGEETALKAKD